MLDWLRHYLDASYLYAQNPLPEARFSWASLLWVLAFALGGALAWRWRKRKRRAGHNALAPSIALGTSLAGLGLALLRPLVSGALSARIWTLNAAGLALAAVLIHWLANRPWSARLAPLLRGLACELDPHISLSPRMWLLCAALHGAGLALLISQGELPAWASVVLGLCLACGAACAFQRHQRGIRCWLRLDALSFLFVPYASALLQLLIHTGLHVSTDVYQAFPYSNLWSPWFHLPGMVLVGVVGVVLNSAALVLPPADRRRHPWQWVLGGALLLMALAWYGATVAIHHSYGATGSDPLCYLQMASDLATQGTALHTFPLAGLARTLGVAIWPTVPVGYHVPVWGNQAPTVWPPAWPALMVPFIWLGGEKAALWAAPCWTVLAALALGWLALELAHPIAERGSRSGAYPSAEAASGGEAPTHRGVGSADRYLVAGLAVLITLTSSESVLWTLVPMADAAAQALSLFMLLCLARARRGDRLGWSLAAGLAWASAYLARHPQLPIGLAALPLLLWAPWPARRKTTHLAAFALAACLGAAPDLAYHWAVFGSPWQAESQEWHLFALSNMPQTAASVLGSGLLRPREFGYLAPLVLYGAWRQWRTRQTRAWALALWASLLGVLAFNLSYGAVRLRDISPLFPWLGLWAAYGIAACWTWACQQKQQITRALILVGLVCALCVRSGQALALPATTSVQIFGYVSATQRAEFDRLADTLPSAAVVGAGLGSGAVARYTGRETFRPASWNDDELQRFIQALLDEGRPIYFLDDGTEMNALLQRWGGQWDMQVVGVFALPTFALGGEDAGQPATLYQLISIATVSPSAPPNFPTESD